MPCCAASLPRCRRTLATPSAPTIAFTIVTIGAAVAPVAPCPCHDRRARPRRSPMTEPRPPLPDIMTIDPATVDNAVLQRLITEVQAELTDKESVGWHAYDRVHNRYNRQSGSPY